MENAEHAQESVSSLLLIADRNDAFDDATTAAPDLSQTHNPSLTHLPRMIVSIAGATTQGEAGCQIAVSEPTSSGDDIILKKIFDLRRATWGMRIRFAS